MQKTGKPFYLKQSYIAIFKIKKGKDFIQSHLTQIRQYGSTINLAGNVVNAGLIKFLDRLLAQGLFR